MAANHENKAFRDQGSPRGGTYHKHQLKLVVQLVLEREGFMGEGVVATSLLWDGPINSRW